MEYIKDYDVPIKYHQGKVNVVADALSRKFESMAILRWLGIIQQFEELGVELQPLWQGVVLANMSVIEPTFIQKIKETQLQDPDLAKIVEHISGASRFQNHGWSAVFPQSTVCSKYWYLKNEIMVEAHSVTPPIVKPGFMREIRAN